MPFLKIFTIQLVVVLIFSTLLALFLSHHLASFNTLVSLIAPHPLKGFGDVWTFVFIRSELIALVAVGLVTGLLSLWDGE